MDVLHAAHRVEYNNALQMRLSCFCVMDVRRCTHGLLLCDHRNVTGAPGAGQLQPQTAFGSGRPRLIFSN